MPPRLSWAQLANQDYHRCRIEEYYWNHLLFLHWNHLRHLLVLLRVVVSPKRKKRVKHCEKKKGKGRALSRKDRIQNALSNRNHQQVLFYDKPLSMLLTSTRTALGYEHSHGQVITMTPLSFSSLFCCHFQPFSVSISIII